MGKFHYTFEDISTPTNETEPVIAAKNLTYTAPACNCPPDHHTIDCPSFDVWDYFEPDPDLVDALEGNDPYMSSLAALALSDAPQTNLTTANKPSYQILPNGSIVEGTGVKAQTAYTRGQAYDIDDWNDFIYKGSLCKHDREPYVLTDGSVIHATAWTDTPVHRDWEPDLAVYADSSWVPECIAYHIGWPDYGIPKPRIVDVVYILRHALNTAREGFKVELGCIGGHGRTGTMLAILDILSTEGTSTPLGGKAAIKRVRSLYCHQAIESRNQEWYVRAAHATIFGNPIPRMPKPVPVKKYPASEYKPNPAHGNYTADTQGRMTWHRTELEVPTSSLRGDILALSNGERFLIITDGPGQPKRLIKEDSAEAGIWMAAWLKERDDLKEEHLAKARQRAAEERAQRSQTAAGIVDAQLGAHKPANAPVQVTDGVKRVVRQTPNGPEISYAQDATAGAPVPSVESTYRDSDGKLHTIKLPIQTKDGEV